MIKQDLIPVSFDVAAFAFPAEIVLVLVVLFMTGKTVHGQLFLEVCFMATAAFCSQMLAQQGILCFFAMVEQNLLPAFFQVAAFALGAITALMLVIFFVEGNARSRQFFLEYVALVAAGAFHFIMFPAQRIFGLSGMVENNCFPAFFHMAGFAFHTEITFVLVVFFMAGIA